MDDVAAHAAAAATTAASAGKAIASFTSTPANGDGSIARAANGSAVSHGESDDGMGAEPLRWWTMFLGIFVVVTLFGNMLVVLSVVRERHLRSVQNYFIASLAVADITVGALVMPLAVYVEVMGGRFLLPDGLCDAWVAVDVLACTASILNLAAISLDRFMAVTQPLRYQQRIKGSRLYIVALIATSWALSAAIALPIAAGANYTDSRVPGVCAFFNPLFVIFSSMGSFFIPTVVMIVLYWKIFGVIKQRARLARCRRREQYRALRSTINLAACRRVFDSDGFGDDVLGGGGASPRSPRSPLYTDFDAAAAAGDRDSPRSLLAVPDTPSPRPSGLSVKGASAAATTGLLAVSGGIAQPAANGHSHARNGHCSTGGSGGCNDPGGGARSSKAKASRTWSSSTDAGSSCGGGGGGPLQQQQQPSVNAAAMGSGETYFASAVAVAAAAISSRDHSPLRSSGKSVESGRQHGGGDQHRRGDHKERKATITLVVVLCVFLICWIPFFVTNNLNAACSHWQLQATFCERLSPALTSSVGWLGYFNSTLNPLIYALLQIEYRRAFARLLCLTSEGGRK